jgi:hypothetical protein
MMRNHDGVMITMVTRRKMRRSDAPWSRPVIAKHALYHASPLSPRAPASTLAHTFSDAACTPARAAEP